MDDNKANNDKNQSPNIPKPIFETISVTQQQPSEQEIAPEEVSPELATPEEVFTSPPPVAPPSIPPPTHRNYMKYIILGGGIGFFIVIFMLLVRLLFGGVTKKSEIALQYWGLWEDKAIYDGIITQYQAKNPHIKVQYQKMSPLEYREKLIARSKNGQGPDIFRFHNTWLPEIKEIAQYVPSNIMSNKEFEATFYPVHAKDLKIGDHYYGLPLTIDGLVLLYNEGLFKKAGIVKAPSTWEDITESVSKLSGKDQNGQIFSSPIAIGTAANVEHFSDLFGLMLVQNGGDLRKLDQPEAAGALESYRKLAEPPTDFWNDSMPNSIAAFIQEKVAMILVPSWEIHTIKTANPDIELKVVPVPQLPGGNPVSIASYWVEGVSKFGKNQGEAWKFLRFLSEKETMTKLYEAQSKTRLFGEPYSRVDLAPTLTQNEFVGAVIQQANYFISIPLISRTYDNGLNDEVVKYLENAVNATIQGVSYSEALRVAGQGVSQVYSRYKIE
ncbi:sugar ABC transporter substrate-binding protein [Candidatus Roizmanbacteria bacterium]|nr:sugar ABC transporter substrate-binding protein [Candidatus Roizmanbacteria bacterium]